MKLMRKMSKALITVLVLASVALTVTPVPAAESIQGTQGVQVDHAAVQEEVNANLNSQLKVVQEHPLCQVPENGLRFDVRGCEKNPQWSLLTW